MFCCVGYWVYDWLMSAASINRVKTIGLSFCLAFITIFICGFIINYEDFWI